MSQSAALFFRRFSRLFQSVPARIERRVPDQVYRAVIPPLKCGRQMVVLENHIAELFADHDCRRVGVPRHNFRHDRTVGDP